MQRLQLVKSIPVCGSSFERDADEEIWAEALLLALRSGSVGAATSALASAMGLDGGWIDTAQAEMAAGAAGF